MPGEILQNINKNNDTEICINEIRNFSRDENNIVKVKDALQEQEKSKLLSSLEDSLNTAIDTILGQSEILENDIKILDLWDKLLWEGNKKEQVKQKIESLIKNISESSNKKIAKNWSISSFYSQKDIKTIQLWANICFGENIKITWERWIKEVNKNWETETVKLWWLVYDISNQSPNDQITNMYIFRQELITRGQVIDNLRDTKFLLNIPNLNNLLSSIPDKSWQDKIFGEFLSFFLEIRRWWIYFENKIWNNNLQAILVSMINAEKYKNTPVDEYFSDIDIEGNLNKTVKSKEDIKTLWYTTMYDYYNTMYIRYKDIKIEDFIKWLEWYPEKEEELKKSFSWFTTAGEYYQSLLTKVSEKPKKSMTIDEYFKEQEDMLKSQLELKNDITVDTMGEYFKQVWDESMAQIRLIHKWNVDENTYLSIKLNLDSLNELIAISLNPDKELSNANKQKAEKLCKKLLELADQTNNSDLKNQILINISVLFNELEISQKFWNAISRQINNTRTEISRQVGEYEEINDILAQIEKSEVSKRSLLDLSRDELKEASPIAYNWLLNKEVYHSSLQDNVIVVNNNINSYSWSENQKTWYKLLSIPWCGPIVLKDVKEEQKIKDLISKANRWEISLVLSYDRINEFSFLTYFGQDLWKQKDNIVTIDDFSYSQKDPNWNILLYKIWWDNPYQTITLEQQQKAKQTNQLALMSTYTPENLAAYTEIANIQSKMWSIQELYNKMWTAKIDRKNVNYLWALFATTNPIHSSLINTYVPVEWWLTAQNEKDIFTQAEQIKDKLIELKTQENSLRQIRQQLFDMQKNIDKSRLTTEDETRLQQSLNAVDFLINGMEEWWENKKRWAIREFVDNMTNSKYVSANGTFTELWAKWFRENWLKFALAIWAAVLVMCTFWGWSLLAVAALTTLAGMGWARLWQRANEWLQNRAFEKTVMVDWKERPIRFDDPTDIELLNQWKLERWEFLTNIGMEFAIGTVSVYGFMKAGQIIWWSISKFADKCPNSKWAKFLKTIKPKFKEINDPYTKNLFDKVAKWSQKTWFWKKFWAEFTEELWQETAEWTAEYISDNMWIPWLAMLVTTWNCLTPWTNTRIYSDNKVSFNGINRVWNNAELELHYDWDVNQLIKHFEANNFKLNTDWTLFKANEVLPTITDVVRLVPSKASVEARSMNNVLENFGIQINHETWDVTSSNPSKLVELQKYIELNNQWNMTINPDWTATISTPNETINIVPNSVVSNILNWNIDTIQRNSELQSKFEHMGNLQEVYDQRLSAELESKKVETKKETFTEAEIETITTEFNIRWNVTLEYFSGENTVKFKWKEWATLKDSLVEWSIQDYGKNLLWEKIYNTPEGKILFEQLQVYMFYQHLDNPLKYCSHWFDHSILVDAYVQNVIQWTPEVVNNMMNDYWLDREWAILALRLTAIFHDFWYPNIWTLAKSMHWPFGWQLFANEFANTEWWKNSFVKLFSEHFWVTDVKMEALVDKMRRSIFYHSADKVETGYLNRVEYTNWEFLVWNDMSNMNDFLNILDKWWDLEITYRVPILLENNSYTDNNWKTFKVLSIDWDNVVVEYKTKKWTEKKNLNKTDVEWRLNATMLESKRNAELLAQKLIEEHNVDPNRIKVDADISSYAYDNEFASDRYQWRKADKKRWDAWIEFKPIDLLTDPLAWIVRLADNMDMSLDRLTEIQANPVFMNLLYNLWIVQNIDNSASNIFQRMEKVNKMKKEFKGMKWPTTIEWLQQQINKINNLPELILDYEQSGIRPESLIQLENAKNKLKLLNDYNLSIMSIQESMSKWIIINDFDYQTWTKKWDINVNLDNNIISDILKNSNITDWSIDINTYKLLIVDQMVKHYNMESDPNLEAIKNVAVEDDTWSYSFRHFAWLTAIKDVSLETSNWKWTLIVKVDPKVFFDSDLSSQSVDEWIDIKLNEYHIWRLYDASGRVLVGEQILNIMIVDVNVDENWNYRQLWFTERTEAGNDFKIKRITDKKNEDL
jgi:hypothetical protein